MSKPGIRIPIDADPKQAQAAIGETIRAVEKMEKAINTSSLTGVRAFRSEIEAAREKLRVLGATEAQQERLAASMARVNAASAANSRQFGAAAQGMAGAAQSMLHSGNLMGEGIKGVVTQGANMVAMFGIGGPIVGALALMGVTVVETFSRARDEIEKTRLEGTEAMKKLAFANPEGGERRAEAADKRIAELRAQIANDRAISDKSTFGKLSQRERITAFNRIRPAEEELKQLEEATKDIRHEAEQGRIRRAELEKEQRVKDEKAEAKRRAEADHKRANTTIDLDTATGIARGARGADFILAAEKVDAGPAPMPTSGAPGILGDAKNGIVGGLRRMADDAEKEAERFRAIGSVIGDSLAAGAEQGLNALITGKGNALKILKRLGTEPIVTEMQAVAKAEVVLAAKDFWIGNLAGAAGHAKTATMALGAAAAIARLGGVASPSGGGGGSGAGSGGGSRFSPDGESSIAGRGRAELRITGTGFLNLDDRQQMEALERAVNDLGNRRHITITAGGAR